MNDHKLPDIIDDGTAILRRKAEFNGSDAGQAVPDGLLRAFRTRRSNPRIDDGGAVS